MSPLAKRKAHLTVPSVGILKDFSQRDLNVLLFLTSVRFKLITSADTPSICGMSIKATPSAISTSSENPPSPVPITPAPTHPISGHELGKQPFTAVTRPFISSFLASAYSVHLLTKRIQAAGTRGISSKNSTTLRPRISIES